MTLQKFNLMRNDIELAYQHDDLKFEYNLDHVFHAKCKNLENRMKWLQKTTKLLQTLMLEYYKGRNLLYALHKEMETYDDFDFQLKKCVVHCHNNLIPDW